MMTREEAYVVLAEELEPIVAFHAGDYNAWKQNNRGRPGITVSAEKLHAIKETIEARKLARLACTPDQIKAYCLANHWAAFGQSHLRYLTEVGVMEILLPNDEDTVVRRDLLIERAVLSLAHVEQRSVYEVMSSVANYKEEDP